MKVPYNWLKEYVDITISPQDLAKELVKSGFEVESIENDGEKIKNVLIGRITKITKHPNADRLQVCHITFGSFETVILTAATNVFEGAVVPAALDGAYLPGDRRIFAGKIRGLDSNGMFCSGVELDIDDQVIVGAEVDGILILPTDAPLGMEIAEYLGMNEPVFDISVTSNRPDCQSIYGIAREVSAILEKPLKPLNLGFKTTEQRCSDVITVENKDFMLCPTYCAALVNNVRIEQSPKIIRDRLRLVGIRPINTVVDITNYVLTEIGQPMHAFDLRDISDGKIIIRRAVDGEKITTLDDKEFVLKSNNLLITDNKRAIAVAGVMGGKNSEIKDDTKDICFEAAIFARGSVRATSRSMGQQTASSSRFGRGVDNWTVKTGLKRALTLIDELGIGDIAKGEIIAEIETPKERTISINPTSVNKLLGIEIPTDIMVKILSCLEIDTILENGELKCRVPLFREDIENYTDIAEEIIRIYGYDNIVAKLPLIECGTSCSVAVARTDKVKDILVSLGAYECVTYSFVNPNYLDLLNLELDDSRRQTIKLLNPLSEEFSVMRTTMIHSCLTAAYNNLNRKNFNFRLFEIARVYLPKSLPLTVSPTEENRLTITVSGESESFFTLKGIVDEVAQCIGAKFGYSEVNEPYLHPGQAAKIMLRGKQVGVFGLVHPIVAKNYDIKNNVFVAEINFDALLAVEQKTTKFVALPKFQEVERDLALTVKDGIKAGDMLATITREGGSKLESVDIFDIYKGKQIEQGFVSIAFKLVFRSPDATLTEAEVTGFMSKINASLSKKFGAVLRQ